MKYIPVDPAMNAQNQIVSLIPIFGDAAKPYPDAATVNANGAGLDVKKRYFETTTTVAAKLGLGDMFKGQLEGYSRAAICDYLVALPKVFTGPVVPDTLKILGTWWGATLRVAMRVKTLDASVSGSYAGLAAAAEVGLAEVQYSVYGVGVDQKAFAKALQGIPVFGKFDFSVFGPLDATLTALSQELVATVAAQPLSPVGVFVRDDSTTTDVVALSKQYRWAMVQIANALPLDKALANHPAWVQADSIRSAYAAALTAAPSGQLTEEVISSARKWVNA